MNLAIFDHKGNHGGLQRVIKQLIPSLIKIKKDFNITYYTKRSVIKRENLKKNFPKEVSIKELKSYKDENFLTFRKNLVKKFLNKIRKKFFFILKILPASLHGNIEHEISNILKKKKFDVLYFPWPFQLNPPLTKVPIISTFHDFNFKYYFNGYPLFLKKEREIMEKQTIQWLKKSTVVIQSKYSKSEVDRFYPKYSKNTKLIYLEPFSKKINLRKKTKKKFIINNCSLKKYILCPTNLCNHKNLGPLIVGYNKLTQKFPDIKLVLVGNNTEKVTGKANNFGLTYDKKNNANVIGLGYVDDELLEKLIINSLIIISPSLYESSENGPCTDGWINGIPVLLANIKSNLEIMKNYNVKSTVFDPFNPQDINYKLSYILKYYNKNKKIALLNQKKILKFNWEKCAKQYAQLFENVTKRI